MGFYKGIDGNGDGRIMEALSLANLPARELIAGGAVDGYEIIHKFGRIASATTSWQNVSDLGGFIPFTGVNMITPIIVSGAGAIQDIEISGIKLDTETGDWVPVKYTVTLNGAADVAIPGDIMSVYRVKNIGVLDVVAGGVSIIDRGNGDAVYAKILDGGDPYNQTQMAFMPIPTGYVAIVVNVGSAVADGKLVQMAYRYKPFGEVAKIKRIFDSVDQKQQDEISYVFKEKGILDVICKATIGGNTVSAYFDIIFIDKDVFTEAYGEPFRYKTL